VAYFRSGGVDQPANTSGIVLHDGKEYVVATPTAFWPYTGFAPAARSNA